MQDMVSKDALVEAISFNALSTDFGRAAGPVLGGYLMGFFGPAVVLFTGAASQLGMIAAVRAATRRRPPDVTGAAGRSLREAWRLIRRSSDLYGPMIRCALLMIPCGGLLGLLPLEAKENIQTGPIGYGGLLAALGIGTAAGGALMPALRRRVPLSALTTAALAVFALAVIGISQGDSMLLDAIFLLFIGLGWSLLSIAHQFAVQMAAPETARGVMNSVYALVLQGSLAAGSVLFGALAHYTGVSRAILAAGLVAMSGLLLVRRYRLGP